MTTITTITAPFTFQQFIDGLLDVAEARPTFSYPRGSGCAYVPHDLPGVNSRCIIGEVLIGSLGVLQDDDFLDGPFSGLNMEAAAEVLQLLGVEDEQLVDVASKAQDEQDNAVPWSHAVVRALSESTVRAQLTTDQIIRLSTLEATTNMEVLV